MYLNPCFRSYHSLQTVFGRNETKTTKKVWVGKHVADLHDDLQN